ncbi:nuclear factor 7, ovary-like [Puntigrus tetrazona]|uniref:nuclear factor 7, ovary-like n=1 Tax=Puntigrus tetrazona TaxID=1606681 RepID=UPI001C88F261|nr:nuclear factor 7, ovary-like [Puntigrus tetrazona]
MDSLNTEVFCPVCQEIFKAPVLLSCSHNVCKECLEQLWRTKEIQECPVCGSKSSKNPSCNLVLKNVCESYLKKRNESRSAGSEEICSLHGEKPKLLGLEDKQRSGASVSKDTQKHADQRFRPVREDVPAYKEELNTELKSLQKKLEHGENLKREFERTLQHIKSQAEYTEHQIKEQFKRLRQLLRDEEASTIAALREEEEQKKQMMKEKLEEMNTHISALSNIIKDMEKMMEANDAAFLEKFPVMRERIQISSPPDPQMPFGGLIYVPRYLGNLPYKVWKKMLNSVQKTPMTLDPNTAHPRIVLSDDLTIARYVWNKKNLPDNPERFDVCECVLGSEGFSSGMHFWEVEVEMCESWSLGVTTESNRRKGRDFCNTNVWCVKYDPYRLLGPGSPVEEHLECVRVDLDYDGGTVSFSDPVTNTHLHTFTATFTDVVFPFFCNLDEVKCLRILPVKL